MLPVSSQTIAERMPSKWFWFFCVIVITSTTVPYLYAWLQAPAGYVFTGGHSLAPGDLPVYFSYLTQAAEGASMFRDLFTVEPHAGFIFSPIWLLIGLMGKLFSLSPLLSFHLARILLLPLLIWVAEQWLKTFLPAWQPRKYALLLFAFGAGFGALAYPGLKAVFGTVSQEIWPMDLWVSEAYTWLTMYQTPHFILATTLLILVFHFFGQGVLQKSFRRYAYSGFALLALMSFHPFHLPTVVLVFAVTLVLLGFFQRRFPLRETLGALLVGGIALPMLLYQAGIILWHPIASARAEQNITLLPTFFTVVLSYGAFLPLAGFGLYRLLKQRSVVWILPLAWLIGQCIAMSLPISFNRRLTEGWILPLSLFALVGAWHLLRHRWIPVWSRSAAVPFLGVLLFMLSPLTVLGTDLQLWSSDQFRKAPYHIYIDKAYVDLTHWIKGHTEPTDIFAAGKIGSLYIPAWSGRPVVVGHLFETIDYQEKKAVFIQALQSDEAFFVSWLEHSGADYLLWGEYDTRKSSIHPANIATLGEVARFGSLVLYQVIPPKE